MATMQYNAPNGSPSSIEGSGSAQMNVFYWWRKAIIDTRKEQFFMPMSDTISMPKNFGKTVKVYQYIPLLDDRNINDQGIDAAGATIATNSYAIAFDDNVYTFAVSADAIAAAAAVNAITVSTAVKSGAGPYDVTLSDTTLSGATLSQVNAVLAQIPTAVVSRHAGNLYGSSKDIGTITGKLPLLTEAGGRVNRVGFTRLEREGTITKFGFFMEWTKETLDFDSDSELYGHLSRELLTGAVQLTEAVLQKDLIGNAGVVYYAGDATSQGTVTAEGAGADIIDYDGLMRLSITLDENRTPRQTKVISGSRMVDTRTISSGRVMFCGSELLPLLRRMEDSFGDAAFIPVHKYADASTIMNGEVGTIDQFRIVIVPEMLHWDGEGATVVTNAGYRSSGNKYNVYPMLVIGDESFVTIGFQTDGKSVKFDITTKMPGKETADRNDPYGETGFSSIKWYYGLLVMRPERLALVKTVAPL